MAITRIGNIASTIPDDSIQNVKMSNIVQSKNILINGDMNIAQRATSASSITSASYNTVDRWQNYISSLGTWTVSQDTTVPTGQGFAKSLKYDCTTADASPSASDVNILIQKFEGQNLQYLKKGTSSAESLTLSFWVRSNKTGTYTCEIFDGDTTGTLDNDNASSLNVHFWLGAGSDFTGGTFNNGTWGAGGNNTRVSSSQVNLADSTSNEWYVTGVQLEASETASDFEFLPVDVNLNRCLRYYETIATGAQQSFGQGVYYNSGSLYYSDKYRVTKRAVPTLDQVTGSDIYIIYRNNAADNFAGFDNLGGNTTMTFFELNVGTSISGTGGQVGFFRTGPSSTTCFIAFDAEL